MALQGETVKHLQLLLVLLRLLSTELLGRVSLVHFIFGEDGEVPPVPATLLDFHFLDDAGVQSRMAHSQASLGIPCVGWTGHHHRLDLAFFVRVAATRWEEGDAGVGGCAGGSAVAVGRAVVAVLTAELEAGESGVARGCRSRVQDGSGRGLDWCSSLDRRTETAERHDGVCV
jgi:hypothetical protein